MQIFLKTWIRRPVSYQGTLQVSDQAGGAVTASTRAYISSADEFFDPRFNHDFTRLNDTRTYSRGGEKYERPYGWYRFGLKVLGKYEDNTWLGPDNRKHGLSAGGVAGVLPWDITTRHIIDEEEFFDPDYDYDFTDLKDTETERCTNAPVVGNITPSRQEQDGEEQTDRRLVVKAEPFGELAEADPSRRQTTEAGLFGQLATKAKPLWRPAAKIETLGRPVAKAGNPWKFTRAPPEAGPEK
ncbi:hypothetical protein L3Q82_007156 [Scortum barcoo]|uniref:Uncharacterized protein n=1 Tax=Scortum barcoo TaxID=214431 RepID=A0ACB8WRF1_9TELE|nr:hypothetical protein L3Q82_007156 [Scortum barcoo]